MRWIQVGDILDRKKEQNGRDLSALCMKAFLTLPSFRIDIINGQHLGITMSSFPKKSVMRDDSETSMKARGVAVARDGEGREN